MKVLANNTVDDTLVIEGLGRLARYRWDNDAMEPAPDLQLRITSPQTGREFEVNIMGSETGGVYTYSISERGCANDPAPTCQGTTHDGLIDALYDVMQMIEDGPGCVSQEYRSVWGPAEHAEAPVR